MKVVGKYNTLTLSKGKIYDVLDTYESNLNGYNYEIINNSGLRERYSRYYFITLSEHREIKLEEILL